MKRRAFITLLGGAAAAWPLAARAQRPSIPVIGFLDATTAVDTVYRVSAFRDGLKEAGFIDGHNVAIEFRWAENKLDRLPALATDLVQRQVAVIAGPNTAVRAAQAATSTIPIVFVSGGDPLPPTGLVTNLSRPGGNITGVSFGSVPLQPKRLGLLHELVPPPATIAWLRDPRAPSFEVEEKEVPPAARELGRQLLALNAQSVGEIDAAFATIVQSRAGALLVGSGPLFNNRRRQLAALAARHGVPAIGIREFVLAGGLMSYGASDTDAYRRAGSHYVAPILRGTKPGDLPIEMPTKYELVISVLAAKALGLDVPAKVLALADEVIE